MWISSTETSFKNDMDATMTTQFWRICSRYQRRLMTRSISWHKNHWMWRFLMTRSSLFCIRNSSLCEGQKCPRPGLPDPSWRVSRAVLFPPVMWRCLARVWSLGPRPKRQETIQLSFVVWFGNPMQTNDSSLRWFPKCEKQKMGRVGESQWNSEQTILVLKQAI